MTDISYNHHAKTVNVHVANRGALTLTEQEFKEFQAKVSSFKPVAPKEEKKKDDKDGDEGEE